MQRQKGQTTIRDIAREADVSISTVSRVLNDHPHVDTATRQVVWKTAHELGYPLSRIRGQAAKPARTIAFISNYLMNNADESPVQLGGIDQLVVSGAQSIFEEARVSTHTYNFGASVKDIRYLVDSNRISGLIFLGGIYNRDVLAWLQERNIPFVTAGAHAYPMDVNAVMANYVQGMGLAVDHLVARGRRHICLVNGPPESNTSDEKYKGFRLSLSLNEIPFQAYQLVCGSDFDVESGYRATVRLLAQGQAVDAIVYAADGMAAGGLKAIKESGRLVPDDVAVVGFHNYEITRFSSPPLTTVGFDMRMMGRLAGLRLRDLMDGSQNDPHVMVVSTRLIVRESTGDRKFVSSRERRRQV